jgi:primosomal protein N' (replication factor Y) (superfamily II helicase)
MQEEKGLFAQVVLPLPLHRTDEGAFTYRVPSRLAREIVPGSVVVVPFGSRRATAVVIELAGHSDRATKEISALAGIPALSPALLALARFAASYYLAPLGPLLKLTLPPPSRRGGALRFCLTQKGRAALEAAGKEPEPLLAALLRGPRSAAFLGKAFPPEALTAALERGLLEVGGAGTGPREAPDAYLREEGAVAVLTSAQKDALSGMTAALGAGFSAHLLLGVTGSGKTEVYTRLAREALARGLSVLLLAPEIALTPLLASRLEKAAPGRTAVLHSGLSDAARAEAWEAVQSGRARLVVGVRSGVFAPVPGLGLIIVDEEHDPSYRQEESPGYSARDVAVKRAQGEGIPVLLGSATPSMESFANAQAGRYRLHRLPERVAASASPRVEVVDLARPGATSPAHPFLSRALVKELQHTLDRGEQAILFLNRRGFAPFLMCRDCGVTRDCPNCSVTLTFHRGKGLLCHHCGHGEEAPAACPACGSLKMAPVGAGTQRIEEGLSALFPKARIARLDRDAAAKKGAIEKVFRGMDEGSIDILVGTQMLAKGHDFHNVTLVGVLAADQALDFPDFRAAERTFQLVAQVAGRAGRGDKRGLVVVQTFHPGHYALTAALKGDYASFYERESAVRQAHGYPPFGRVGRVLVEGARAETVQRTAEALARRARSGEGRPGKRPGVRILGPSPAPLAKVHNRHRWHFLVLARDHRALAACLAPLAAGNPSTVRVHLLVDAVNFL